MPSDVDAPGPVDSEADAVLVSWRSASAKRMPLDRDRIVSAAVAFIDANGLAALSMRRLARLLGVEAMSLYQYVSGRGRLLDAVVDSIVDEMYDDADVRTEPVDGWQDFLQRLARGVRRMALAYPLAFPLVASRPAEAPWLRPPLRSLAWVESCLAGLIREGFDDEEAVAAYRSFTSFLLGHLLLEVPTHAAEIDPLGRQDDVDPGTERSGGFVETRRLRHLLADDPASVEFEASLGNLLDRLTLLRGQHSHRQS